MNTGIIGVATELVPSSCIDRLAGESRWVIRNVPPAVWACAANGKKIAKARRKPRMKCPDHVFGTAKSRAE